MFEAIYRAAIQADGVTYSVSRPGRHNDVWRESGHKIKGSHVQGFVTTFGRFVDRKEALRIAEAGGQMKNTPHPSGDLFTEDIW